MQAGYSSLFLILLKLFRYLCQHKTKFACHAADDQRFPIGQRYIYCVIRTCLMNLRLISLCILEPGPLYSVRPPTKAYGDFRLKLICHPQNSTLLTVVNRVHSSQFIIFKRLKILARSGYLQVFMESETERYKTA
jgi:hypothetical protein